MVRKKALEKQLRKEEGTARRAGGAKRTADRANRATGVDGKDATVLAAGGAKAWSTARCRRKVAELRSSREAHWLQAAFVAGHEARVENSKLRAASAPCGGKLSAVDRLRLLRERVVAKQADGQGRCSVGLSGWCVPTADLVVPPVVPYSSLAGALLSNGSQGTGSC